MKKLIFSLLVIPFIFLSVPNASAVELPKEVTDAFPELSNLKIGDLNSECLIDLLNDRFGINAGSIVSTVGLGIESLIKDDKTYENNAGSIRLVGGTVTPKDESGWLGNFVDGTGKVLETAGAAMSTLDMNDLSMKGLIDMFDPKNKPVFDGPGLKRGARIVRCNIDKGISTGENLIQLVIGWTKFLLQIAAALAVVVLIYAGFTYVVSMGDDNRMQTAKKTILFTILGLILILGSYAIVNTLMQVRFGVLS